MSKRDVLQKLSSIRHAERVIAPDAAWVSRTRLRVMTQVKRDLTSGVSFSQDKPTVSSRVSSRLMQWMRAPALVTASIVTAVFGGSLLSVSASERALPGDLLYPIKLASEQTQLALTSDPADKLRLKTQFVGRRVDEIKTLAAGPVAPDRLVQATQVLKRDLDTVKNQLQEVKQAVSAPTAVEVAKLVDQQSDDVAQQLKAVKSTVPEDVKSSVADAEVAAVHTGVSAVAVLIDAKTSTSSADVISDADVAAAIQNKVDGIQATLTDASAKLVQSSSTTAAASSTGLLAAQAASSSVEQIASASTTLQEVRQLVDQNQLGDVTSKLLQAAQTAAQVETAVDLATASSTSSLGSVSSTPPDLSSTTSATDTPALNGGNTSTPATSSSTTATTSTQSVTPTSTSTKATSTSKILPP